MRLDPEQRLVDDRGGAEGTDRVVSDLFRLPVSPCDRILPGVLASSAAPIPEQRLEVSARVEVERGQHAVELYRTGRAGYRERCAGAEVRRARAARRQVDVEVALEEDARADQGGSVGVDRERVWSMSIVTIAGVAAVWDVVTLVTCPASTPAIRTGEGMCSSVLLVNTALSTNGDPENGTEPPNTR